MLDVYNFGFGVWGLGFGVWGFGDLDEVLNAVKDNALPDAIEELWHITLRPV